MQSRARSTLSLLVAALLVACAAPSPPALAPAPAPEPPRVPAPVRDEATAAAIERILAGEHRSAENRARDTDRHPLETLLFFGIKAEMTVVEIWPDAGGGYTEVLAPLLAGLGKLYVAQPAAAPGNPFITGRLRSFADKLAAQSATFGKVEVTAFGAGSHAIAPEGSADLVVSDCNLHHWMNLGLTTEALAAIHQALKPGGILGVVGHRGDPSKPQDPRATNGYVNEEYAIELMTSAGFELVARSEVNANARDTKDHPQGVWSLPPHYRLGNRDRAKYEAIGESDRFTLKFKSEKGDRSIFRGGK